MTTNNPFFINSIEFYPDSLKAKFCDSSVEVNLDARSMELLKYLAHAGEKGCSREALLDTLWPDKIVSDDSLTNLVSQTRSKLKPFNFKLIKTIPKKGYIINGDVLFIGDEGDVQKFSEFDKVESASQLHEKIVNNGPIKTSVTPPSSFTKLKVGIIVSILMALAVAVYFFYQSIPSKVERTLAILPIEAFSSSSSVINGAAIFTEELTHQFTNYPGIFIVSRTEANRVAASQLSMEEMSNKMGAKYLIEGSVRESGDTVRITVQLIDGFTGLHVFSRAIESTSKQFAKERESIIQLVSRLAVVEMPTGMLNDSKQFDAQVLSDKCDSYLELANLYATSVLKNIDSVTQPAETACIAFAQVKFNDAAAASKIVRLYYAMAVGAKNAQKTESLMLLARQYLDNAFESDPELLELFDLEASLNLLEIREMRRSSDNAVFFIEKSLKELQQGLALYPQSHDLLNSQGVLYRRLASTLTNLGQDPHQAFKAAEASFDKGLLVAPDNSSIIHNFARLKKTYSKYLVKTRGDPVPQFLGSIKLYHRVIELRDNPAGHIFDNLGNSYSSYAYWLALQGKPYKNEFESALLNYQKALKKSENPNKIHNNLADLHNKIADIMFSKGGDSIALIEKGMEHAHKALEIKPNYIWPMFNLMSLNNLASKIDYAKNKNIIPYISQCIDWGEKGLSQKSNLAGAWIQLLVCEQIQVRMFLENEHFIAANSKLKRLEVKIDNLIKLDSDYDDSFQIKGINQLLRTLANKQTDFLEAIKTLEQAVLLNADAKTYKISLLESYLYHFNSEENRTVSLSKKINALIILLVNLKAESAEFQLQLAIYSKLEGTYVNLQDVSASISKKYGLTGKAVIRQYQFFLAK